MEPLRGSFKATYPRNGKRQVRFYGSMVNVRISFTFILLYILIITTCLGCYSWCRKKYLMVCGTDFFFIQSI
jgi:hypothetical protein